MKTILTFLSLILVPFVSAPLYAQTPSVELRVDRSQVALNDLLTMVVTIKGGSALTRPEIPSRGNFEVAAQASGNNIEIINGVMSVTNTFTYQLRPRKEGSFVIGPVSARIDGKTYSAGPARVVVTGAKQHGSPYRVPTPGYPQLTPPQPWATPQSPPGPNTITPQELTFLKSELNKQQAYVGEQILYTFRLYSAVNLKGANLKLPDFKDFIAEELVKQRQYEVDLGGRRYGVNEWRLALIPTKAGKLSTGKASIQARVAVPRASSPFQDPFFRPFPRRMTYEEKIFQAPNQSIEVKALPKTNTAFTGLVGDFEVSSQWDQSEMEVGESAHWTIEISGQGNLQNGELPDWPKNPLLKVYPATPTLDLQKSEQGLLGKKVFKAAYVGSRPGVAKLSPMKLSYFNPQTKQYEFLEVPGQSLKIIGNGQTETWVKAGGEADFPLLGGNGLSGFWSTPRTPAQVLAPPPLSLRFTPWLYLLLIALPLLYFVLWLGRKIKTYRAIPSENRKRSLAFKKAKKQLLDLKPKDRAEFLEGLPAILKTYLQKVYHLPEGAFTAREVERFLEQEKVPSEQIQGLVYLIDQLEQYRYSPNLATLSLETKTLQSEVLEILRSLER